MTDPLTIRRLVARPVGVPVRIQPVAATGAIPTMPLVLLDLETADGVTGRAYLFAFAPFAVRPLVAALEGLADLIAGDTVAPFELAAKLRRRLTLIDTPGILGLALSGIDICAWDALARAAGLPLATLLGGQPRPLKAYNSCGLWIGPVDALPDQASQLLAEGGYEAVKLRLGRADFAQDLAAVRKVKARIGDAAILMVDFNQSLSWNEAIRRGRALDDEGLYWIEEPIRHDDFAGAARIAAELATPLQLGENLQGSAELLRALDQQAMDFVMPDVQRIGGVSGWLRAAALAQAHGMEMSSHLFPEVSAHLLAVTPTRHWLEYVDWASPVLQQPLLVRDGHAAVPDRPGTGVDWDEDAVSRFLIE